MNRTTAVRTTIEMRRVSDDDDDPTTHVLDDTRCVRAFVISLSDRIDAEQCGSVDGENITSDYSDLMTTVGTLRVGERALVRMLGSEQWPYMVRVK